MDEQRDPPIFSASDFGGGSSGSASAEWGAATWISLIAFVGTILFCAVQAAVNPRRTFCAMDYDAMSKKAS